MHKGWAELGRRQRFRVSKWGHDPKKKQAGRFGALSMLGRIRFCPEVLGILVQELFKLLNGLVQRFRAPWTMCSVIGGRALHHV